MLRRRWSCATRGSTWTKSPRPMSCPASTTEASACTGWRCSCCRDKSSTTTKTTAKEDKTRRRLTGRFPVRVRAWTGVAASTLLRGSLPGTRTCLRARCLSRRGSGPGRSFPSHRTGSRRSLASSRGTRARAGWRRKASPTRCGWTVSCWSSAPRPPLAWARSWPSSGRRRRSRRCSYSCRSCSCQVWKTCSLQPRGILGMDLLMRVN
mmetsp:Transcript_4086/g.10450  ORF Transcript_4086/g.10450 Transcript_4086/m.10450 type:complete len:208 (-) Transcript_4086:591-1214(-)